MKFPFWRSVRSQVSPPRSAAVRKNAASIVDLIHDHLKFDGFLHRKGKTLWRVSNRKFDVVKFTLLPAAVQLKWNEPPGSFLVDVSCLFPFLPQSGHTADDTPPLRPEQGFGQIRLRMDRGIRQREIKAPNIWWAGFDEQAIEAVSKDILTAIADHALPFFSRFEDVEELLRTFVEDEQSMEAGGVWGFGRKESPIGLLYTGFTALECEKWDLAITSLNHCREKLLALKGRAGETGAAHAAFIDLGLARAAEKRRWSLT